MTDNSCVILGVSRSLALTLHSFPRWGNYANMPRFLYDSRRLCLGCLPRTCPNMLSFVAHIHVLFLPALFSRVEAIANLINYDTNASGVFGQSSGYLGSSGPLRDTSAPLVTLVTLVTLFTHHTPSHTLRSGVFGIPRLFGSSSGFFDSSGPLYACAGWEHTLSHASRSPLLTLLLGIPFVLSTNQKEPPPFSIQYFCIKLKRQ